MGGRRLRGPAGPFVIEMLLQGGGREFVTSRNVIDRFTKAHADDFVARLQEAIDKDEGKDPFCYTDQSKAFGRRSTLIEQFGGKERLLVIERARVRSYDERFAARYTRPGHWYAPLAYLRDISTGEAFSIIGSVVLLRAPLSLANYLANWREAGIHTQDYELVSLLNDREFDDFMLRLEDQGLSAIVDPIVASDTSTHFASGLPIRSVESIKANP